MRVPYTSSASQINRFLRNLNDYLDSGIYCDLTFLVGCKEFPCHRIILASSSSYFQALLTHKFKENNLHSVEIHNIDAEIFSMLLHYIYSGQIEIDHNNVQDILIASDMLQLEEVVQFCCHFLSISLNENNVVDVWKIADELECRSLKDNAEHYMLTHFYNLIKLDMIKLLPRSLLIRIISNDNLIVDNEQQVLEAILIWYFNNHEKSFEQLFDNVRFEYISKEHQQMILNQMAFKNSSIVGHIEQIISHRECRMNRNSPARRGMRKTCYLFGGYGSHIDDNNSHLLTVSYRCYLNVKDVSSLYSIEVEEIQGEIMRYPRMHHQIEALGSLIYVVGGEDGDNIFNSVEIFDPLSKTNQKQWMQTSSMITPRCNFGLVSLDSTTLYVLGGHIGADITSTIEMFNCKTGIWTLLPYKLKNPCYGFACVQLNGLILCIGGSCIFNLPVKTTEIFNPRTGQSYLCADMNEARSFCSACVDDEQETVYVFGGADAYGNGLCSAELYSSIDCRWYKLPSMFFNRISPCVYRIDCFVLVFGGRTNLTTNSEILHTAEIFHIEKKTWMRTNDVPIRVYGAATVLR